MAGPGLWTWDLDISLCSRAQRLTVWTEGDLSTPSLAASVVCAGSSLLSITPLCPFCGPTQMCCSWRWLGPRGWRLSLPALLHPWCARTMHQGSGPVWKGLSALLPFLQSLVPLPSTHRKSLVGNVFSRFRDPPQTPVVYWLCFHRSISDGVFQLSCSVSGFRESPCAGR